MPSKKQEDVDILSNETLVEEYERACISTDVRSLTQALYREALKQEILRRLNDARERIE